MSTTQLDVRESAGADNKPKGVTAGPEWVNSGPLKSRYASPTGLMSFDGETAWSQYDPHILVPKAWGKQTDLWKDSLRNHEPSESSPTRKDNPPSWKHANTKKWPLNRRPKYERPGIEVNL
jgi:hypothetical protein